MDVPRLTQNENEKLINKLLDDHADDISARERPRLLRQIAEQSQGLPRITRELVKRVAARGELSTNAVRREDLHGAKPLDMTPGLVVFAILLAGMRVAMRPLHDPDMMVLFGFSARGDDDRAALFLSPQRARTALIWSVWRQSK